MPARRQTPTVRLRRLAAELRQLRKASELTQDDVAERTGINAATLYRIERARVRPQTRTLRTLLDLYGVPREQQGELVGLLREARQRGWLHAYQSLLPEHYTTLIGFEGEAQTIWNYESLFVPGLLQTEDYARAVIGAGLPNGSREEVERRVDARMKRQEVLQGDHPVNLWAIVDEAALRREVGGPDVMRVQLRHLAEVPEAYPHVTLQVIPFKAGAHAGMPGSFVLLRFPEAEVPDVVYIDSMAGDLFLEDESAVSRYTLVFDHRRAVAASPDVSRSLIASMTAEGA
jgi:transcriptional regulator with XRE-family HTH domain